MHRDLWAIYDLSLPWAETMMARNHDAPTATVEFWVAADLAWLIVATFEPY